MGQRWLLLVLITLGACFSPNFNDGAIQCGPDMLCPPGFECSAGVCRSGNEPIEDAPAGTVTLSVTKTGAGTGEVQSAPVGLDCGATCTQSFPVGTMVTLTATPAARSTFTQWSGDACSGASSTCTITLTSDTAIVAEFGAATRTLTVVSGGNGTGSISSTPAGITCPGTCTISLLEGTPVVLTATPSGASTFLGWTAAGICTGTGTCSFTLTADTTVTGSFALDQSVIVTKSGTGMGTVTSTPPGISCGSDCNEVYPVNTVVTLQATPDASSDFIRWDGGGCSGNGSCVVTVTAAVMVTAIFNLKEFPLTVAAAGTGAGMVTSSPAGISCNAMNGVSSGDCSESYASGTMVTLTAVENTGSGFTGWSDPSCTGSTPCMVTVTAASTVTATFALAIHRLEITKPGNGAGLVTSGAVINCGADCSEDVAHGTMLVLTAAPATGSEFLGWSVPACGANLTCAVTVTEPTTVSATFTLEKHELMVSTTGNGSVVTSDLLINCGSVCLAVYDHGTVVTLTPIAGTGSSFSMWTGSSCSGSGACNVTMDQARTVGALFTVDSYDLQIDLPGTGAGNVTSNPAGINCGTGPMAVECTASYLYDTDVTLTATAASPSLFAGWSGGGCSGTSNECVVTMSSAQMVSANFSPPPNRMFVTSQTYVPGALGGLAGADMACQMAASSATPPLAGTYRAWLSTPTVNAVDRLGTASGWVRVDGKPFANTPADVGAGHLYHPPRIDENSVDVLDVTVMTATFTPGVYDTFSGNNNCAGFTTTTGTVTSGSSSGTSDVFMGTLVVACNQPARLYCFGVDRQATVIPPPPTMPVRRAFMRILVPGGGILDADAQCQADATANSLPGTYKALLATNGASALSRFVLSGPPWIRVDHVPILPTAAEWATATAPFFDTGPNLSANGTFMWGNFGNWIGAPSLTSAGSLASTCTNWTGLTQSIAVGNAGRTRKNDFTTWFTSVMCNFTSGTITCLQE